MLYRITPKRGDTIEMMNESYLMAYIYKNIGTDIVISPWYQYMKNVCSAKITKNGDVVAVIYTEGDCNKIPVITRHLTESVYEKVQISSVYSDPINIWNRLLFEELEYARTKFPISPKNFAAFVEEVGEVAQGLLDNPNSPSTLCEIMQCATMLFRLAFEGDQTLGREWSEKQYENYVFPTERVRND